MITFSHLSFAISVRPLAFLGMLILLVCSACQSPRDQLVGTWTVDIEALNQDPEALKIAPPAGELARTWKMNMVKDWVFRFNQDQSLEMNFHGMHYQGRYQITSQVGKRLYIKTEMRSLPANGLDALLNINASTQKVVNERFTIRFIGDRTTLGLNDFTPIALIRSRISF
jgi:hypothetical protein